MEIAAPYLMFLGDVPDALAAKTAHGIVDSVSYTHLTLPTN